MQHTPPIFGTHAVQLRCAGLAVIPARGKKPICAGFNAWKNAPSIETVEQWAEKVPDANIVYVPGLSKSRSNPHGLVVVDADNEEAIGQSEKVFGKTPAMIDTRRGRHFLYRAPEVSLGKVGSLRKAGFEIDIKHGQKGAGISVAPPSRHDSGFEYAWTPGSGHDSLTELPTFETKAVQAIIDRGGKTLPDVTGRGSEMLPNETQTAPRAFGTVRTLSKAFPSMFREGSRKLGLNDHLAAHAWAIEDFDNVLDIANAWNDDLFETWGIERLPNEEVVEVCKAVIADVERGKLVRKQRQRATCLSDADEVRHLAKLSNGDAAFMLLQLFRAEHSARMARGETFVINIDGMVEKQSLGGWSAGKYRRARDTLISLGLLKCVREYDFRRAAEYILTERVPTASIAERERMREQNAPSNCNSEDEGHDE